MLFRSRVARGIVKCNPLIVGFGISTPSYAVAICEFSDGAIVGSALLNHIGPLASNAVAKAAGAFARSFRTALDARL